MTKNKKLAIIISSSCLVVILVVLSLVSSANPLSRGLEVEKEGIYNEFHIDNFSDRTKTDYYYIDINGEKFALNERPEGVEPGQKVVVRLPKSEGDIIQIINSGDLPLDEIQPSIISKSEILPLQKNIKIAVIPVNFSDSTDVLPFTKQDLQLQFDGYFKNFFLEQSYGQLSVQADVLDWITLPRTSSTDDDCGLGIGGDNFLAPNAPLHEMDPYLTNIINDYDELYFIASCNFNTLPAGWGKKKEYANWNFSFSDDPSPSHIPIGVTYGNKYRFSEAWYDSGLNYLQISVIHELLHTFGMGHSHGFDCDTKSVKDDPEKLCTGIEYGDTFDAMGGGRPTVGVNGYQRKKIGWINSDEVLKITKSGTYNIGVLNTIKKNLDNTIVGKKYKYAEIYTPDGRLFYTVEYRLPIGVDSHLDNFNSKGITIRRIFQGRTFLLDLVPTTLKYWDDIRQSALQSPQNLDSFTGTSSSPKFIDPFGLKVDSVAVNNTGAKFNVTYPLSICVPKDFTGVSIQNLFSKSSDGRVRALFIFGGRNNDPEFTCPVTKFNIKVELLSSNIQNITAIGKGSVILPFTVGVTNSSIYSYEFITGDTYDFKVTLGRVTGVDSSGHDIITWSSQNWIKSVTIPAL